MFYYDPVCGKKVNRHKVQATVRYEGETYYLCCPVCQSIFEKYPQRYAGQVARQRGRTSPPTLRQTGRTVDSAPHTVGKPVGGEQTPQETGLPQEMNSDA